MAKNLSREFATMDEDERRRFALERGGEGEDEPQEELAFDDPRNPDRMGRGYATPSDEVADPEHRDGLAAQADTPAHDRNVRRRQKDDSAA